uniref:Protein Abitram n=1 Tax=Stomoxys calcitrans TaxID=35570 RepID=A0A1I8NMG3_STOCA
MQIDPLADYYFQHEPQIICGEDVKSITDEYVDDYPSVVDRFFTRYYYIKKGGDQSPYQVLFHSNRICLICLAPEHPAFSKGIASINFDIGQTDRAKNTVKGKGKKGGMVLQHDSTLALLTTKTGDVYKIPSCVRSKLVEVNTKYAEDPESLITAEEGAGYFAIVLPKPEHCEEIKASLMNQEQYDEYMKKSKASEANADE